MMNTPVCNPEVPCVHPIPGGMFPGRIVRVKGNTPPTAKRFAINLQCGPGQYPVEDITFHLNPCFTEMCIFRNHFADSTWGVEQTIGGLPLNIGDPFDILIHCYHDGFKVALNRKHFCKFSHRLPFHKITHVMVDGDVVIQQIAFEGPPPLQQENVMELLGGNLNNMAEGGDVNQQCKCKGTRYKEIYIKVLCVQPIPGGMFPGRIIRVKGSTPPKAKRFAINLKCGTKGFPRDDIAFHFNPRFDLKHIVRNHFDSSIESWGDEETGGGLPLNRGECFEALIQCYYDCFKVALNDTHFCEFSHRIPYHRVSHVMIKGDVILQQITIEGTLLQQVNMTNLDPKMHWKYPACAPFLREVPPVHPFPGGMYPGRTIRLKGTIPPEAKRFAINLQCGPKIYPREDIAFHFNPLFGAARVVCNHFLSSDWGDEQLIIEDLPLNCGASFEVLIVCFLHCFKVALNREHFCEFHHRIAFHRVTHISVDGDVIVQQIAFEGASPPQETYMTTTDPLTVVDRCHAGI
ncbi:galectin-6-like [Spodoptera litura]|uniref:Galectin n=1 Tax=Spodoptera litura TaxID=69820 RepID=A0A9J7DZD7_SPOLT|nr:galectin-6-like [Spodoptera litura]